MEIIDSTRFQHRNLTFQLRLAVDHDASPTDYDCYSTEDIEAWRREEWQFVGVLLDVAPDKITGWSLWSVEYGQLASVRITLDDLVQRAKDEGWCDETVRQAKSDLGKKIDALRAINARY